MGGMVLAYNWRLFLILLAAEVILALINHYICVMPLSLCLIFPVIYVLQTSDAIGTLLRLTLIPVFLQAHTQFAPHRCRSGGTAELALERPGRRRTFKKAFFG